MDALTLIWLAFGIPGFGFAVHGMQVRLERRDRIKHAED